jgi:Tfp pilus assembly protein PilW
VRRCRDRGFSLIEAVIAAGLTTVVTAGVFGLLHPARGSFGTEPEVADLQQRLRVGADTLARDLLMAGAGAYLGSHAGSLTNFFAPVLPFRQGAKHNDPPGTFATDRITLTYVPSTGSQTTIVADVAPHLLTLEVAAEGQCPLNASLCGFARGMSVLVFDDTGNHDLFTITSVTGNSAQVAISRPAGQATTTYAAGAKVVEAVSDTYFLKTDDVSETYQLMHYDGTTNADATVVDHVVGLRFDYDGEPNPPTMLKPVSEPAGPWTTYGPKPPASDVKPTAYPAGENCTFMLDDNGDHVPRLAALGSGPPALVALTPAQLTDGPWCPDAINPSRWDADLLRIRRISVTLRVETAAAALRGPASVLFSHGGTSRNGARWVPDQEVRFQVSPRNLNLGR